MSYYLLVTSVLLVSYCNADDEAPYNASVMLDDKQIPSVTNPSAIMNDEPTITAQQQQERQRMDILPELHPAGADDYNCDGVYFGGGACLGTNDRCAGFDVGDVCNIYHWSICDADEMFPFGLLAGWLPDYSACFGAPFSMDYRWDTLSA